MGIQSENSAVSLSLPPRERLSHAYILISLAENKAELAYKLAAHMLCTENGNSPCGFCANCRKIFAGIHPDIITIERPLDDKGKPKREVYVAQIRSVLSDSVVLPNEASHKVYIILDAEFMNSQAQNALLKLLEEPPRQVKFILGTENPGTMLDTIRSRCIELSARTEGTAQPGESQRRYLELANRCDRLGLLKFCLEMEEFTPAQLQEFIQASRLHVSRALSRKEPGITLSPQKLMEIYELLTLCLDYMQVNVSVKQVLSLISTGTISHIRN